MSSLLEVTDIRAGYGAVEVLHGVSLEVEEGSVVALVGPNSAGKTTLLRVIGGQLRQHSGDVKFREASMGHLSPAKRTRQGLCLIPGGEGIFRSMTVRENISMSLRGRRDADATEKVATLFPALIKRLNQRAGTLSGGEQQMLAMARAFVTEPALVIADELSLGLAPIVVDQLFESLSVLRDTGVTVLVVEQYIHRALALADRAYVLNRGEVTFGGLPSTLSEAEVFEKYLGTQ
jgi:branched-chain amino acid transport system ATP-binding protein